jgi:hypothetical protein
MLVKRMRLSGVAGVIVLGLLMAGCVRMKSGNDGQLQSYAAPTVEAGWIRIGEPIDFDGRKWYPQDDTESLLDSEVYQVGENKGVPIFVEKIDAKPYDRLYTKFANGRFRYYERMKND